MDVRNPIRSIIPSVEGDVLAVLVKSHLPLTGARVAALAERSGTQVRAVLGALERHGIVDSARHGQATTYRLNRDHVLIPAVELAARAPAVLEERLVAKLAEWSVPAVAVALFGSFARRDGDADSDIDILVVRPDEVGPDDGTWAIQRHDLATSMERWSGNDVQVVELSGAELSAAVGTDQPLIAALSEDAVLLVGDLGLSLQPVRASTGG